MTRRVRARAAALAPLVGLLILLGQSTHAANRYDPRFRFRTIVTPRFEIHFHQGEESVAQRLARIAEEIADRVDAGLGPANGRVQVILVDQTDVSNGWASPAPYNVIEIAAASPPGAITIGNTDDWLRLVFSHEYTHIVHLDKVRGWIGGLRRVFGRNPTLFPNLFLPLWQVEGIATYNESALTGRGRVPAGDFRNLVDAAAAAGRFEPIDRANGGLTDWPSGEAHYAYGAYFHQYLADRFGAGSLARLSEETAGRIPYLSAPAFRTVFGESLGALWKDFEMGRRREPAAEDTTGTRLTGHGFSVYAPEFSAEGRLFYAVASPHGFPAVMELSRTSAGAAAPRQVASKYLGGHLSTHGGLVVFDQLEVVHNVALFGDLYAVSQDGGPVRRLTRGARAADPDVSPDGTTIVCTTQAADRRSLAVLPMPRPGVTGEPVSLISEAATDFASPRWGPDGRTIVAERRRRGGPSEIVLVEVATAAVRVIVSSAGARNVAPVWMEGGRRLVFASDRGGEPFSLYDVEVASGAVRRLNGTGTVAQAPALSPDGATLVYVGYTADGYDLFSISMASATWTAVPLAESPVSETAAAESGPDAEPASAPYRAWRTLAPRFWEPLVDSDHGEITVGAGTAAADALGRHGYAVTAAWTGSRLRPDWTIGYAYDRWWPTFFGAVSDDTDPWRSGRLRTREASAGAMFPIRRVRWAQSVLAEFNGSRDAFDCPSCAPAVEAVVDRRSLRLGWSVDTARSYGYSISRESGGSIRVTAESTRQALGSTGNAAAATLDARFYVPVRPRHAVVASRIAMATTSGDERIRRSFTAAGAGPQPGGFRFGTDAIGLLRGISENAVTGPHVIVGNLDYRFPILEVQRGAGTLPFFLRRFHGALFLDAGTAWTGSTRWSDMRRSFGVELSADTVLGYSLPLTFSGGVAWRDAHDIDNRGVVVFGRIGRAF